MESIKFNNFSAGWCPTDAVVGGRPNGFQVLDNLDLDSLGNITLCGGCAQAYTAAANVHSLAQFSLSSTSYLVYADVSGNVGYNANNTGIATGGSATRCAFSLAFGYILACSSTKRKKYNGTTVYNLGITAPVVPTLGTVGGGVLTGTYDYAAIGVRSDGTYVGKSVLSTPVTGYAVAAQNVGVSFATAPSTTDPQVTEAWIFRRWAGTWYRVLVVNAGGGWAGIDSMTDAAAQALNITFNTNLISVASSSISDDILELIGPVGGRWYYFTSNYLYPSDINNPDLVDTSLAVRISDNISEKFLWAKKAAASVSAAFGTPTTIMVGTTLDIYTFHGTFATQSNGTIDAVYLPLGVAFAPTTWDAYVHEGKVYYAGSAGMRSITFAGQNESPMIPNVDKSFTSISGKLANRSPIVVRQDTLYFSGRSNGGSYGVDCYEFTRNYWRTLNFNLSPIAYGDITALAAGQDGYVYAAFTTNFRIRKIDAPDLTLLDGSTEIPFQFATTYMGGENNYTRKDFYTFKSRVLYKSSAANTATLTATTDAAVALPTISLSNMSETFPVQKIVDVQLTTAKSIKFSGSGSGLTFNLADLAIVYDSRPEAQTSYLIQPSNFGSSAKKRVRVWSFVLDCRGNTVTITPNVDGVNQATANFTGTGKQTYFYFFNTDVFGIDYGASFTCTGEFEFWEQLQPDIVQILPHPKRFDQVGPDDLFKYGKIAQFEIRLLAYGTSIPYTMYFNDNSQITGSITTVNGKEGVYIINCRKFAAGQIVRLELGPTSFNFHRFYVRALVSESGKDTDRKWLEL